MKICEDCAYHEGALNSLHPPCLVCEDFSEFKSKDEKEIDYIALVSNYLNKQKEETTMRIGLYPGSFDPPTLGHLDMIERAAKKEDVLYIGILVNPDKKPLFTMEERESMLIEMCKDIPNVKIIKSEGFLVDCAKEVGATTIYRGFRTVTDFEYEIQMAHANKLLNPNIETVFLATNLELSIVSSSMAKIFAKGGKDVSKFVTPQVEAELIEKFSYR